MHQTESAAAEAAEVHRNAYNAAFHELGLRWFWPRDEFARLYASAPTAVLSVLSGDSERDCLRQYLQQQQQPLLRAYDVEFLIDAIHAAKARRYAALTADGCQGGAFINWAEIQQAEVGS